MSEDRYFSARHSPMAEACCCWPRPLNGRIIVQRLAFGHKLRTGDQVLDQIHFRARHENANMD